MLQLRWEGFLYESGSRGQGPLVLWEAGNGTPMAPAFGKCVCRKYRGLAADSTCANRALEMVQCWEEEVTGSTPLSSSTHCSFIHSFTLPLIHPPSQHLLAAIKYKPGTGLTDH